MKRDVGADTDNTVSNKTVIMTCVVLGAFFLNDLIGLINGGGMFSATAAIRSAHAHVSSLNVDQASLRTPFLVFCAFLTTITYKWFRIKIERRWAEFIFIFCIIGGGFVLDAVYGPWMIEKYLVRNGYSRCAEQDHSVGSGKGRVWFDNYVLNHTVCPPRS